MNEVQRILSEVSDDKLKQAVREMKAMDDSGVLPNGVVQEITDRMKKEVGLSENNARRLVWQEVFRLAAFRWANL